MALSQLQKSNESDKTMIIKDSQALKKLDSPYDTRCIMPNMKNQKRDHIMMNGISIAKAIQLKHKITSIVCLGSHFFSFLLSHNDNFSIPLLPANA